MSNTLNLENLIKDNTPDGMEIDKEASTDTHIVFKPLEKSTRWESLESIKGFYTTADSQLEETKAGCKATLYIRNIYYTREQALASLAQAKLSQIKANVNSGWVPSWTSGVQAKYCIRLAGGGDRFVVGLHTSYPEFLAFRTKEIAEKVLKENLDVLEQYKPLLV